jgi:hypothetical protein
MQGEKRGVNTSKIFSTEMQVMHPQFKNAAAI